MQIVTNISEEDYKRIGLIVDMGLGTNVDEAIANGTPLPKAKTGHWEWYRCDMYVCSECKNVYTDLSGIKDGMNYCPNCGAKMAETEVEDVSN